jgi:tRNA A-37 threonylcarbamoyl transferase component Bud32
MSGIVIGGLVVAAIVFVVFMYGRQQGATLEGQHRDAYELHARELQGAHEQNESLARQVQRMLAVWQIPWEHVTLSSKLAEGTFGEVWAGQYSNLQVAIKVLKKSAVGAQYSDPLYASAIARMNAETAEELRKECETLQLIRHPNLLIFYGAGTSADGRSFMVTELLAGGSLRAALHDASRAIEWNTRLRVAVHVASGMQHLHSLSIVHRDLKSDNVLLDREFNAKVRRALDESMEPCGVRA